MESINFDNVLQDIINNLVESLIPISLLKLLPLLKVLPTSIPTYSSKN